MYEYTTDMLVKVARVENKAHAGFELLKQDLMTLGIKYEYTTVMLTRMESTPLARRW